MSAVFEAVGDLVEGVGDVIGDAVEWVGDTVSNVVEAAIDDPIKAIAQVAAVATGNAWALPVIEGVDVLEEGGSIEDALKAAAITYVVQEASSYAIDSFAPVAEGAAGSGTTTFFDDGSSIQFFDDGSRLITDSAGSVSSAPSTDVVMPGSAVELADAVVGAPSAEDAANAVAKSFPVEPQSPAIGTALEDMPVIGGESLASPTGETVGEVAPGAISPENVPIVSAEDLTNITSKGAVYPDTGEAISTTLPAAREYETLEQLLIDRGVITPEQALDAVSPPADIAPPPDIYDLMPEDWGNIPAVDRSVDTAPADGAPGEGTNLGPAPDGSVPGDDGTRVDPITGSTIGDGLPPVEDRSIRYQPDTDFGLPPVEDRSVPYDPTIVDKPILDSLTDLGGAALDWAKENPWTTAGIIGGGLALTGGLSDENVGKVGDATTSTPEKKTYTYGAAPPIRRTGLQELYSAASNIYGDKYVRQQLGIPPPQQPVFQSSFQPLLSGQAPGAGRVGLGSLGQGFTYTPMGTGQTFDISSLTPEQIVQLQDMVNRRKQPGGG